MSTILHRGRKPPAGAALRILALTAGLTACLGVGLPLPAAAQASAPAPVASGQAATSALARKGQALFNGKKKFGHNGPACHVCHTVNGGHGGTSGPNLTQVYQAIGKSGLDSILTTWPVPAMRPLYISHNLTQEERDELAAFFAATERPGGVASLAGTPPPPGSAAAATAPAPPAAPVPPALTPAQLAALADQGERLFSGSVRFANRGPACIACHSAATIPFPNGGTLGPDLTHIYGRLGADGVASALSTLYFPAMMPLYVSHPLTVPEQQALGAFLERSNQQSRVPHATGGVIGIAVVIFLILLAITGYLGRRRLTGVRRRLMEAAARAPRRADEIAGAASRNGADREGA